MADRPRLHAETLRVLESFATRARDQRLSFELTLAQALIMARANFEELDVPLEPAPRDPCTCRVHGRPSAYGLTRRRLGMEKRA